MIEGLHRFNFLLSKASRLWRRVGIKRRTFNVSASRPEPRADHLMRISLACYGICSHAFGGAAPGEARHAQVEAAPEKMYRTILADELGSEFREDVFAQDQDLPETVCI